MSSENVENYDDVTMYGLTAEKQEHLLLTQNELTFIWTNKDGHGMGVTMSFIWRKGRIWCTATEQRARMKALARDPRCSVVISSAGIDDDVSQSITFKGHAVLHYRSRNKGLVLSGLRPTRQQPGTNARGFCRVSGHPGPYYYRSGATEDHYL